MQASAVGVRQEDRPLLREPVRQVCVLPQHQLGVGTSGTAVQVPSHRVRGPDEVPVGRVPGPTQTPGPAIGLDQPLHLLAVAEQPLGGALTDRGRHLLRPRTARSVLHEPQTTDDHHVVGQVMPPHLGFHVVSKGHHVGVQTQQNGPVRHRDPGTDRVPGPPPAGAGRHEDGVLRSQVRQPQGRVAAVVDHHDLGQRRRIGLGGQRRQGQVQPFLSAVRRDHHAHVQPRGPFLRRRGFERPVIVQSQKRAGHRPRADVDRHRPPPTSSCSRGSRRALGRHPGHCPRTVPFRKYPAPTFQVCPPDLRRST